MEKIVWVIGNNRKEMMEAQRKINSTGSMRAFCMLSFSALKSRLESVLLDDEWKSEFPSTIIVDYQMDEQKDFCIFSYLKKHKLVASVPLVFMMKERTPEKDEDCYQKGAIVVISIPFSKSGILRMERLAWQYDMTKNYEKRIQKQSVDLKAAKEILHLNQQLKARNDLLYQIFGRYFSDEVLDMILKNPEGAAIGGRKQELTVLISDLRGFTALSEDTDSVFVTQILNYYLDQMVGVITKYKGTVLEFLGDGVLAVFGSPITSNQHAEEAVLAGIEMQNSMVKVNQYCKKLGFSDLEMGIGIHSGEAFIGNVGSEKMMRYNVIGSVVNACSRIESCSIGGQVLVSEETLSQITLSIDMSEQESVYAKGIHHPILLSEVYGIGNHKLLEYQEDNYQEVKEHVTIFLYPIERKLIIENPVHGRLKNISRHGAIIEIEDLRVDLNLYHDVELLVKNKDDRVIYQGIYAKVIEINHSYIGLHFTSKNKKFNKFLDDFLNET